MPEEGGEAARRGRWSRAPERTRIARNASRRTASATRRARDPAMARLFVTANRSSRLRCDAADPRRRPHADHPLDRGRLTNRANRRFFRRRVRAQPVTTLFAPWQELSRARRALLLVPRHSTRSRSGALDPIDPAIPTPVCSYRLKGAASARIAPQHEFGCGSVRGARKCLRREEAADREGRDGTTSRGSRAIARTCWR